MIVLRQGRHWDHQDSVEAQADASLCERSRAKPLYPVRLETGQLMPGGQPYLATDIPVIRFPGIEPVKDIFEQV